MSNEEAHELEEISTVGSAELSIDPPIPAISDPDEKHANEVEQTKLAIEAQIDEEGSTAPTVSATEKKPEEDSTMVTKSHEKEEKDTTVEGIISVDEVLEKDEAGDRCDQNTKNIAELQLSKEHEYSEGLAVDIVQGGQPSVQHEKKVELILISNTDAEKSDATSNVQNVQFGSVSHSYEPIISYKLADPFPERSSDIVTSGGPNVTSTRAVYQPETRNVVQPDAVTQYIPQQPPELYRGPVTSERYFPVQPEQQNYSPRRLSNTTMPYIGSQVIAR